MYDLCTHFEPILIGPLVPGNSLVKKQSSLSSLTRINRRYAGGIAILTCSLQSNKRFVIFRRLANFSAGNVDRVSQSQFADWSKLGPLATGR